MYKPETWKWWQLRKSMKVNGQRRKNKAEAKKKREHLDFINEWPATGRRYE